MYEEGSKQTVLRVCMYVSSLVCVGVKRGKREILRNNSGVSCVLYS